MAGNSAIRQAVTSSRRKNAFTLLVRLCPSFPRPQPTVQRFAPPCLGRLHGTAVPMAARSDPVAVRQAEANRTRARPRRRFATAWRPTRATAALVVRIL
jgi:hypothetical protein